MLGSNRLHENGETADRECKTTVRSNPLNHKVNELAGQLGFVRRSYERG
jgi:hypothetical protein